MRVAIIGNSGSGKSTLARRRAAETEVPILDLDTVAWAPGKIAVPRDPADAAADVGHFCDANEDWIVEGCYASLIEATLPRGPELLVLDPGVDQCTENCRSRPWEQHKYASKQEQDEHLAFLLTWVAEYYSRSDDMSLSAHKRVYEGYGGEKQWLSSLTDQVPLADETT
jgi:adenylate kinase family enzyme